MPRTIRVWGDICVEVEDDGDRARAPDPRTVPIENLFAGVPEGEIDELLSHPQPRIRRMPHTHGPNPFPGTVGM